MADLIDPRAERWALEHTTPLTGATATAADGTVREFGGGAGMMAGLAEARLLEALVALSGARRVLEIGTFTGVGTLALAAALPEGGTVTTIEVDPHHAEVAAANIGASEMSDRVELLVGDARELLAALDGPFDVVWIDAWKDDYPAYFEAVRDKLSPRGVIAADNLFRAGAVLDVGPEADDGTLAMRRFADLVQADPEFGNVLLTIGDGVVLAWRRSDR